MVKGLILRQQAEVATAPMRYMQKKKIIKRKFASLLSTIMKEFARELLADVIALLLVVLSLSFVYLYCLSWLE
jgi:hypothetical protein